MKAHDHITCEAGGLRTHPSLLKTSSESHWVHTPTARRRNPTQWFRSASRLSHSTLRPSSRRRGRRSRAYRTQGSGAYRRAWTASVVSCPDPRGNSSVSRCYRAASGAAPSPGRVCASHAPVRRCVDASGWCDASPPWPPLYVVSPWGGVKFSCVLLQRM